MLQLHVPCIDDVFSLALSLSLREDFRFLACLCLTGQQHAQPTAAGRTPSAAGGVAGWVEACLSSAMCWLVVLVRLVSLSDHCEFVCAVRSSVLSPPSAVRPPCCSRACALSSVPRSMHSALSLTAAVMSRNTHPASASAVAHAADPDCSSDSDDDAPPPPPKSDTHTDSQPPLCAALHCQ